ncbi:MAG TPA: DNA polymerase III subunit delta [Candidatus Dormibacteraeota bacterium]
MPDQRALLLHGEETFLVEQEAARVLAAWRQEVVSDFGFEALDPVGLTPARLRDAILQAPFLDPWRVVAVRGVAANRADALAAALPEVPETTRLLLAITGRLAAGGKLLKAFQAIPGATVREHQRLRGRKIADWAVNRGRELGLPMAAAALVPPVTPPELAVIDAELRKLADYQAGGGKLDRDTVKELLAGGREDDVFRLTDDLLPRPGPVAFKAARSLLRAGGNATTIGYRIARHIALVLEVRSRMDRGQSLADVQAEMREHPFVLQKAYDTAAASDPKRLEEGLGACLDYEWEVKSGQLEAEAGLDALLARL